MWIRLLSRGCFTKPSRRFLTQRAHDDHRKLCYNNSATYALTRSFTEADVVAFVELTGDRNPLHVNQIGASQKPALMPGMLTASMFPALIGSAFPGALYLRQTLKFKAAAAVRLQLYTEYCPRHESVLPIHASPSTLCLRQVGEPQAKRGW